MPSPSCCSQRTRDTTAAGAPSDSAASSACLLIACHASAAQVQSSGRVRRRGRRQSPSGAMRCRSDSTTRERKFSRDAVHKQAGDKRFAPSAARSIAGAADARGGQSGQRTGYRLVNASADCQSACLVTLTVHASGVDRGCMGRPLGARGLHGQCGVHRRSTRRAESCLSSAAPHPQHPSKAISWPTNTSSSNIGHSSTRGMS